MGDTTTPNIGLIQPEVGASRSTWGNKWNDNADTLDTTIKFLQDAVGTLQAQVGALFDFASSVTSGTVPIGAIFPWPMFTSTPAGFLACTGAWELIANFPTLYGILGTNYGGDGVTTFGLPDLRGCVLAGADGGTGRLGGFIPDTPGAIGGSPTVTLQDWQMPSHLHGGTTDSAGQHSHSYIPASLVSGTGLAAGVGIQIASGSAQTGDAGSHSHNFVTDTHGGGLPHPNLQVTAVILWIIRAI